jgi:hypothetical protein
MPALVPMIGKLFGRLTVTQRVGSDKHGHTMYECHCVCGEVVPVLGYMLQSGRTQSCGCLFRDLRPKRTARLVEWSKAPGGGATVHGLSRSATYQSWSMMIQRCTNPKRERYPQYGGAGVMVCERWQGEHGFEHFLSDVGERPEGTTLSRYLDSGNYEPKNVEWATPLQQGAERKGKVAMLALRRYHQLQFVAA